MSEYDDYVLDDPPATWGEDECLPVDQLHLLIGNAARPKLDQGDVASAVEAACRALRDLLRQRLGSDEDGRALVDGVGQAGTNPRLPLTPNRKQSQRSQHDGIVHLLRGVVAYVRNLAAHKSQSPFAADRCTTLHVRSVMSLCASHVEDSGTAERGHRAVDNLSQPDYPRTREAIVAAVVRVARWPFAGYDHVISVTDNSEDVLEITAAGVSHLLLRRRVAR